jgi:hypothetical protein
MMNYYQSGREREDIKNLLNGSLGNGFEPKIMKQLARGEKRIFSTSLLIRMSSKLAGEA